MPETAVAETVPLAYLPLAGPVLAMVALTFLVWLVMFARRLPYMMNPANRYDLNAARTRVGAAQAARTTPPAITAPADNFQNLFEMPVLFYAVAGLAIAAGVASQGMARAAWVFVALRVVHSLIHCTYNNVSHRFLAYLGSSLALAWLAVQVGVALAPRL